MIYLKRNLKIFLVALLFCFVTKNVKAQSAENFSLLIPFYEDSLTAYSEVETENKWDYFVYPIPTVSDLTVRITRGQVSISSIVVINETGDEVLSLNNQSSSKLRLDLSDLEVGSYFIRIFTDIYNAPKVKRFYVSK